MKTTVSNKILFVVGFLLEFYAHLPASDIKIRFYTKHKHGGYYCNVSLFFFCFVLFFI
jgi:hypothetical protein